MQTFVDDFTTDNADDAPRSTNPMRSTHDVLPNRTQRRSQVAQFLKTYQEKEQAMDRSALGSFLDIQKRRLVNEIVRAHAGPNGEPFVLVLDKMSTFLISTQLSMKELMYPTESVCLVENVMKKRQPNPCMEAVYFIQPSAASIKAMVQDFASNTGKAQYGGIHIILTGKCPPNGIALIKSTKRLVQHMITFREIAVDVFPTEPYLINFGLPNTLNQLFGHGKKKEQQSVTREYQLIAERMVSVCSTLHEIPHIRVNSTNARSIYFYSIFADKLKEFLANNPTWKWHDADSCSNGIDRRSTLIVLDRRDDLTSVLRHEFSYQALVHDTLEKDIKAGLGQTSFEYSSIMNGNEISLSLSDTDDPIWMKFRHQLMTGIGPKLHAWFNEYKSTEAYKIYEEAKNSPLNQTRKIMTFMRTKDATNKILKTYKQHCTVVKLLVDDMKDVDNKKLLEIAEVEGQIITGYSVVNGALRDISMSKIKINMIALLSKEEVVLSEKLRLILLWFVTFGGETSRSDAQKIVDACVPRMFNISSFFLLFSNTTCPQVC